MSRERFEQAGRTSIVWTAMGWKCGVLESSNWGQVVRGPRAMLRRGPLPESDSEA